MSNSSDNEPAAKPGIFGRMKNAVVLPPTISQFEASYLARMNKIAMAFFWAHLPIFLLISWVNDTDPLFTLLLSLAVLAVPTLGCRAFESPRSKSLVFGFTSMCMGGILVHIGQGPVQIEMHFYFFSVLAMLALFANPMVIVVAAVTVALHHLVLWYLLPASVFNYEAPLWVVLVHAAFVVLETFAACFIARNFFDNVIGLEKKVEERTVEIRQRNEDMRLVLDNVVQGLVTVAADGKLSNEHSKVLEEWFGSYEEGTTFAEYIGKHDAEFGNWFGLCWDSLGDDFLPLEMAIEQLPSKVAIAGRHYRFDYQAILGDDDSLQKVMVVVSDVTADIATARAEAMQREILSVFERILQDRSGFNDYFDEAEKLVEASSPQGEHALDEVKRYLHTLKGNSSLFGLDSVADICHRMEESIAESDDRAAKAGYDELTERWGELSQTVHRMLGKREADSVTLSGEEYKHLLQQIVEQKPHVEIARELVDLSLEPVDVRLDRFADQARALAERLEKGAIEVRVDANGVRMERERFQPFWSAFSHVLRNAVDHGLETPDDRVDQGKTDAGHLDLRSFEDGEEIVVELRDDGRGIDWEMVRSKAASLGLANSSQAELVDAMFTAGFSTRDDVTDVSGRGVGLSAVKEACVALGGRIETVSESGRGTSFQFRFPADVAKNDEALSIC